MSMLGQLGGRSAVVRVINMILLGAGLGCSGGPTGPTPDALTPPTQTPTVAVTISPTQIQAALSTPTRPEARYLIDPLVTFSAVGTNAAMVKELTFSFIVDSDRVIKQGALLVHGGDLRRGPVTQRYPLTFDVPVHFPNLRVRMAARFVDGSGEELMTAAAEASIHLPVARP